MNLKVKQKLSVVASEQILQVFTYVADSVQSVLPLLEHFGIATAEEADLPIIPERLRADVAKTKSAIILPTTVMAWTRLADKDG